MHDVIYFMTEGMFTLTRDGAQKYIFDVFDFRLHSALQFWKEKEILWRFCCEMEPTAMKKMFKIFPLEKQLIEREQGERKTEGESRRE